LLSALRLCEDIFQSQERFITYSIQASNQFRHLTVLNYWFIILLSHKTICVSEKTKIDAPKFLNKKKLIVIKNGLDPVKVYERDYARKILEVNNDEFLVGTLSELHRIKGLDILLKAWHMFRVKLPGKLIIFGEGEEKDNLLELVKKLNIENDVVFKGFNIDASKLISGFDVFIMSSISENMPYALLEAGSAGRAVIATRVGGIPEVVENNISGILIKPNDKDELVCGLEKLYKDSELRNNLGKALYDNVNTNFSLKKMIKETFKVYEY
jgi:glycosyltransferase involved in cell wall biosynthesis